MVLKNKEAKKYYEILKAIFPKTTYMEEKFLRDMQRSIAEFCLEYPTCTYEMISEEFGTPQEVLLGYLDAQDENMTIHKLQRLKIKKWIGITIIAAGLLCVIIYSIVYWDIWHELKNSMPTRIKTNIYTEGTYEKET